MKTRPGLDDSAEGYPSPAVIEVSRGGVSTASGVMYPYRLLHDCDRVSGIAVILALPTPPEMPVVGGVSVFATSARSSDGPKAGGVKICDNSVLSRTWPHHRSVARQRPAKNRELNQRVDGQHRESSVTGLGGELSSICSCLYPRLAFCFRHPIS